MVPRTSSDPNLSAAFFGVFAGDGYTSLSCSSSSPFSSSLPLLCPPVTSFRGWGLEGVFFYFEAGS